MKEEFISQVQPLKKLRKKEFFKLKNSETAPVWIRGNYIPSIRKYQIYKSDDTSHERLLSGNTNVFVGFTY